MRKTTRGYRRWPMPKEPSATGLFDLRRWLEKAKAIGQLKEVEGADLKFELGCITDLNAKRGGPTWAIVARADRIISHEAKEVHPDAG